MFSLLKLPSGAFYNSTAVLSKINFFLHGIKAGKNEPILPTQVTNKNTGFAVYCPWAIIVFIGINALVSIEILML